MQYQTCSKKKIQLQFYAQIKQDLQCQGESISLCPLAPQDFIKIATLIRYKLDLKQFNNKKEQGLLEIELNPTPIITGYASELIFLLSYTSLHAPAHIKNTEKEDNSRRIRTLESCLCPFDR
jgi:hypothetical protein